MWVDHIRSNLVGSSHFRASTDPKMAQNGPFWSLWLDAHPVDHFFDWIQVDPAQETYIRVC